MASTYTHTQVRNLLMDGTYQVDDHITASANIAPEAFVFRYADNLFDHVATADDILTLPNTPTLGQAFYRLARVTIAWVDLGDAIGFAAMLEDRLKLLLVDYFAATTRFVGTTTETLSS